MRASTLTPADMDTYNEVGYVVLPSAFGPDDVARMRQESDRLVSELVTASVILNERNPRLDLQRRDGRTFVRKIQPLVDRSDVFASYASDERLLGPLREILGCEPKLMEEKLNCKQELDGDFDFEIPDTGDGFEAHTDFAYFRMQGYPRETLSSAISIDASTSDNGPLRVLPGSHLREWPEYDGYPPLIVDGAVKDDDLVEVLAPEGSIVIFHSALVHASSQNRSGRPRRILILSHYPSTHAGDPDRRNRPLRERAEDHERRARAAEGWPAKA